MAQSKAALVSRLTTLFEQMLVRAQPRPYEDWAGTELTLPQFRTLNLLRDEPKRMSDIAARLGIGLPSATAMIDRLVEKALVEREHIASDRRVVVCRLTAKGQQEVERFSRVRSAHIQEIAAFLSRDELEAVVNALGLLLTAVNRQAEDEYAQAPERTNTAS